MTLYGSDKEETFTEQKKDIIHRSVGIICPRFNLFSFFTTLLWRERERGSMSEDSAISRTIYIENDDQ